MKRVSYWLPPMIWMGVIFFLSTDEFSARNTGSWLETVLNSLHISLSPQTRDLIHYIIRKTAHLTGYAILALLFYRAVRTGRLPRWRTRTALIALALTAAYAILDETHQSFTHERAASVTDVLVDCAGGVIGTIVLRLILIARDEAISQARLRSADH